MKDAHVLKPRPEIGSAGLSGRPVADPDLALARRLRALPAGGATDPFFDARVWGAPTIGPETIINAPFGWIGLVRHLGRMCATLLGDTEARILVLILSRASGISVEVERCGTGTMAALHSLAAEVGQAAACIEAETGLLSRSSLRALVQFWTSPRVRPPSIEHLELSRQLDLLSVKARRRLVGDVEILWSGAAPSAVDAPILKNWNLGFPPGAVTVEIVGVTGAGKSRRLIAEPLIAMDRLRRFARTTHSLYRLRSDEPVFGGDRS